MDCQSSHTIKLQIRKTQGDIIVVESSKQLFLESPRCVTDQTYVILWLTLFRGQSIGWLYNYFFQLVAFEHYKSGFVTFDDAEISWKECPFLNFQIVDRTIFQSLIRPKSVSETFVELIANDNYIYLMLDQFYNPNHGAYQKDHYAHYTFIYGFDLENRRFNIGDFFNGQYTLTRTISFEEVDQGFMIDQCHNNHWLSYRSTRVRFELGSDVVFFKYIPDEYSFDTELFKQSILDYLNAKNTIQRMEEAKERGYRGCIYGIGVYQHLKNAMEYIMQTGNFTWNIVKSLIIIKEHKEIMIGRLSFLYNQGFIKDSETISNQYHELLKLATLTAPLFLKYRRGKDQTALKRIIELLDKMYTLEKSALNQFINDIIPNNNSHLIKFRDLEINRFQNEISPR
jgi:hypothetical protein